MDKIKIELIGIDGIKGAHRAVKKPYRNEKADGKKLLYKVAKIMKHESVLEHISFQFDVTGSSILELQEHMRTRIASPTVESSRYALSRLPKELAHTDTSKTSVLEEFLYKHTVFTMRMLEEKNKPIKSREYLLRLESRLNQLKMFCSLMELYGADEAKYELIESFRTSFVWTINLRSMLNFIKLRTAKNAHFEIRQIANEMHRLLCENEEIAELLKEKEDSFETLNYKAIEKYKKDNGFGEYGNDDYEAMDGDAIEDLIKDITQIIRGKEGDV